MEHAPLSPVTGERQRRPVDLLAVGAIYFLLFSVAVAFHFREGVFLFPEPGAHLPVAMARDLLLGALGGLAVCGASIFSVRRVGAFRELAAEFHAILGPLTRGEIFFLSAFSALGEEFFFRGYVQGKLGLVAASLIFGLLHIGPGRRFLPWTFFAVFVGFLLGGLYLRTRNLLAPAAMHFAINLVNLTLLPRWANPGRPRPDREDRVGPFT